MNFPEKLKSLRKQKGLSQEEFAERFDVSRQAVSKWESGRSVPELEKIVRMSEFFQVSTDHLLHDDPTETVPAIAETEAIPDENEPSRGSRTKRILCLIAAIGVILLTIALVLIRISSNGEMDPERVIQIRQLIKLRILIANLTPTFISVFLLAFAFDRYGSAGQKALAIVLIAVNVAHMVLSVVLNSGLYNFAGNIISVAVTALLILFAGMLIANKSVKDWAIKMVAKGIVLSGACKIAGGLTGFLMLYLLENHIKTGSWFNGWFSFVASTIVYVDMIFGLLFAALFAVTFFAAKKKKVMA
jgi:transcriptional regulator with XRE-family HTH domain